MQTIEYSDFQKLNMRIGTIVRVENFEKAKKSSYKIWIDLGDLGIKKSAAQITHHYTKENLVGKQVVCVCNFKPKQIADFISEVLVTGFDDGVGQVVLASSDQKVPNGSKLF